ncbi:hypothetical protein C5167_029158 [Papaver somniferum]|nr:hypothetical protein C5167_029158 [Papaver somniferum]
MRMACLNEAVIEYHSVICVLICSFCVYLPSEILHLYGSKFPLGFAYCSVSS